MPQPLLCQSLDALFWHGVAAVLPDYCRVPYTCILKLCLLTGYIKPSAAVLRARELAKLALKRGAFDQWAERLREIIA